MKKCLNNKWKSFRHFSGDQVHMRHWQAKDIESFSIKCSNLKLLIMGLDMNASMQSWPMLAAPWTSLQDITIHCRPNFGRIFEDVELHMTLPNLWRIVLTEDNHLHCHEQERQPSFLPDLRGCNKLKYAIFMRGFYRFGDDILPGFTSMRRAIGPGDDLPLPQGLDTLNLMGSTFHEEFMNRLKYEDIKKVLPQLERLILH